MVWWVPWRVKRAARHLAHKVSGLTLRRWERAQRIGELVHRFNLDVRETALINQIGELVSKTDDKKLAKLYEILLGLLTFEWVAEDPKARLRFGGAHYYRIIEKKLMKYNNPKKVLDEWEKIIAKKMLKRVRKLGIKELEEPLKKLIWIERREAWRA